VTLGPNGLARGSPKGGACLDEHDLGGAVRAPRTAHEARGQRFAAAPCSAGLIRRRRASFYRRGRAADVVERVRPALDAIGQRSFVIATRRRRPIWSSSLAIFSSLASSKASRSLRLDRERRIETSKVHELLTETLFARRSIELWRNHPCKQVFAAGFKMALVRRTIGSCSLQPRSSKCPCLRGNRA